MEDELEQKLKRVAAAENADYSISADAAHELASDDEISRIFRSLDQQLG